MTDDILAAAQKHRRFMPLCCRQDELEQLARTLTSPETTTYELSASPEIQGSELFAIRSFPPVLHDTSSA